MPVAVQCPFYKKIITKGNKNKVICEGAVLRFPSEECRRLYINKYCASICDYHRCTVARMLGEYYDNQE